MFERGLQRRGQGNSYRTSLTPSPIVALSAAGTAWEEGMTYDWDGVRARRMRWMKVAMAVAVLAAVLIVIVAQT